MSRIAINNLNSTKSQGIITLDQKELQFIQGGLPKIPGTFISSILKLLGESKNKQEQEQEQTQNVYITVNCCCKDGDG